MDQSSASKHEKVKLKEINSYLTCHLCKGYFIDATTISECLHSFCRSCIIKFLQENSYCPICEVIINKAKPNIKLDKTLQDIVYKLVPELFINEMQRRQRFYQHHPELAAKCTPEERGEDTERTIFNPKDLISLSIEYVSDENGAARGILTPSADKNTMDTSCRNGATTTPCAVNEKDTSLKRFLQCPGMCRIEVLKKFVRNKYNVDTTKFHIDILYKRVPLPNHHTLIDIAYIYSWKRNEPMKFYFRIVDKNMAEESFDLLSLAKPIIPFQRPQRTKSHAEKRRSSSNHPKPERKSPEKRVPDQKVLVPNESKAKPKVKVEERENEKNLKAKTLKTENGVRTDEKCNRKTEEKIKDTPKKSIEKENCRKSNEISSQNKTKEIPSKKIEEDCGSKNKDEICKKTEDVLEVSSQLPKITDEIKNQIQNSSKSGPKIPVYTNITLNRSNNVEIITKIQKVSNKNGQPIGLNIIKQTVKKYGLSQGDGKGELEEDPKVDVDTMVLNEEKRNFMKMVNLTAVVKEKEDEKDQERPKKEEKPPSNTGKKRKQSSPKPLENPSKKIKVTKEKLVVESNVQSSDLQNLFGDCKINIPSSLSITLKESSADCKESPTIPMKPVQNYIEIVKLPEVGGEDVEEKEKPKAPHIPCKVMPAQIKENLVKLNPRSPQSFQKMFEETLKNPNFTKKFKPYNKPMEKKPQKKAMDLTKGESSSGNQNGTIKRKVNDIASDLIKKNRLEQILANERAGKIPIPRLNNFRTVKPPQKIPTTTPSPEIQNSKVLSPNSRARLQQIVANLHSPRLGMNYSVSVSQSGSLENQQVVSSPTLNIPTLPKVQEQARTFQASPFTNTTPAHVNNVLTVPRKQPSPQISPKKTFSSPHEFVSPRLQIPSPNTPQKSPKPSPKSPNLATPTPPKPSNQTKPQSPPKSEPKTPESKPSTSKQAITNQLMEKYNMPNLAQLTASFNINPTNLGLHPGLGMNPTQLAIQQAMILRHFEMQNRQNWLNMNANPIAQQYEKFLQSLNQTQNQILGKEN